MLFFITVTMKVSDVNPFPTSSEIANINNIFKMEAKIQEILIYSRTSTK